MDDASDLSAIDPVVRAAMRFLSDEVNRQSLHPLDRPKIADVFRILSECHYDWDPETLRTWARQHGWETYASRVLRDRARDALAGKRFRTPRCFNPGAVMRRWRAEARREGGV